MTYKFTCNIKQAFLKKDSFFVSVPLYMSSKFSRYQRGLNNIHNITISTDFNGSCSVRSTERMLPTLLMGTGHITCHQKPTDLGSMKLATIVSYSNNAFGKRTLTSQLMNMNLSRERGCTIYCIANTAICFQR